MSLLRRTPSQQQTHVRPVHHRAVPTSPGPANGAISTARAFASNVTGSRVRRNLILAAESEDGSGMTPEQVQKAMDTQLRQSSLIASEGQNGDSSTSSGEQESPGKQLQKGVAERTGLLDDDQIAQAIQRQVGATHADWSHDEEDQGKEDQAGETEKGGEEQPAEEAQSDSLGGTETDDGVLVFTADELNAVSYDDLGGTD